VTGRITGFDWEQLERDGFVAMPNLVRQDELATFERDIALAGERLAIQRGVERRSDEPIADVLKAAGPRRSMLFDHIKRLFVLERLSVEIGVALEQAGLFRRSGIEAPIVWPTLRADLPGEFTYVVPLHQDYATTRCRTAWRLWIPLRAVDRHHGTMEVAPGSHRTGAFPYITEGVSQPQIERRELDQRGLSTQILEMPAGGGVIFNPRLVHASVPNASQRTKWVLLLHIQDLAGFVNPNDPADPLYQFLELSDWRKAARLNPTAR
jgi:hypothetical protein